MSNNSRRSQKTVNAAKENVNVETVETPVITPTDKINIDALAASLEGINLKPKNILSRKGIYKYSEDEIKEMDADGGKLQKKIRNTARRKTDAFLSNIALSLKAKDVETATTEAKKFVEYYKERFILNDFSLDSVRESSSLSATETLIYSVALKFASEI